MDFVLGGDRPAEVCKQGSAIHEDRFASLANEEWICPTGRRLIHERVFMVLRMALGYCGRSGRLGRRGNISVCNV